MTLMEQLIAAAISASDAILEVYHDGTEASWKADGSPVTVADARAEEIIIAALSALGLPVLAEESVSAGRIPALGERYFVVDPLDGTKEFLKRNGEFTVNIALCENGAPTWGIVMSPVTRRAYFTGDDPSTAYSAVFHDGPDAERELVHTRPDDPIKIVASRSHGHPAIPVLCEKMRIVDDVTVGSSLKFGLLAIGEAQLYPRFGPTSEWDTAAGQAVLQAAGGVVWDLDGRPLTCGHADRKFLNGPFVAAASPALAEAALAEIAKIGGH
ncbi:MAG TPA: 3'(2'),5'-bisphosphate nucleotidase CysQ [Devosia sp.]|nr:3'(2'),5'-bisphosphate nucleotidase CysQ [Devosia sp.]